MQLIGVYSLKFRFFLNLVKFSLWGPTLPPLHWCGGDVHFFLRIILLFRSVDSNERTKINTKYDASMNNEKTSQNADAALDKFRDLLWTYSQSINIRLLRHVKIWCDIRDLSPNYKMIESISLIYSSLAHFSAVSPVNEHSSVAQLK